MFILKDNWLRPAAEHFIFDFHLPGYPVVPGAISAGLLHQSYCAQLNFDNTSDVDIFFQKPLRKDTRFKVVITPHLSELIDFDDNTLVKLCPTKKATLPDLRISPKIKTNPSKIIRPPELIFHRELSVYEKIAQCTLHYEDLLISHPYLSSLAHKNYFVCLETMGNLAMELFVTGAEEVFVFHSFKGVWFDWQELCGELTISTSARRINSRLIQWSSQIINRNQKLIGYVSAGLNVLGERLV